MVYVSISAYNDGDLLGECIRSVRNVLGDEVSQIDVVDGKYETWPEGEDNSTDVTQRVAEAHGAEYKPLGPFEQEVNKHRTRVEIAPRGEFTLLLDADERLVRFEKDKLDGRGRAFQPKIHNPIVYGNNVAYWPRVFLPEAVDSIGRWDKYFFDSRCYRTDYVAIAHRHDLRDPEYRKNKYERLENEERFESGYYVDDEGEKHDNYFEDELDIDVRDEPCMFCGEYSVVESLATPYAEDNEMMVMETCVNCSYRGYRTFDIEEYRYVPNNWKQGFAEDPKRLRQELAHAGCQWVRTAPVSYFERKLKTPTKLWCNDEIRDNTDDHYESMVEQNNEGEVKYGH